jgi:SAM-dependent methyltransferase
MARISFDILKTIEKRLDKPLKECTMLDIGCWSGRVSLPLAKKAKSLLGVDIRRSPEFKGKNVKFVKSDVFDFLLKCKDKFDIIICSEVIEHIVDQRAFLDEVRKCLKDDGLVYLTTNNKYWWKEGHYGLPFLTYLPKFVQKKYIHLFNKERTCGYDVTELFSHRRLNKLFRECGFDPDFVVPEGLKFPYSIIRYLLKGPMWNFSVGFMVLAKNKDISD